MTDELPLGTTHEGCLLALSDAPATALAVGDALWPDGDARSVSASARGVLAALVARGLAAPVAGARPGRWVLTPAGSRALGRGDAPPVSPAGSVSV